MWPDSQASKKLQLCSLLHPKSSLWPLPKTLKKDSVSHSTATHVGTESLAPRDTS